MKRFLAILLILALLPVPATFARQAEPSAIPEEAFDAVTADVWDEIEAIEAEQIVAKRGKNSDAADYAAIVDDVIAAVEASDTYLEGSLNRNGSFFTWRTTEGVACGYSPRLRARLRKTAIEGANPEDYAGVETTSYATKGGSPSSTSVAVFQPYYGLDSSFKTTYANEGKEIAQAMGGTSTLYKTTSATIDAIADAFESCAVVIFDSHGDTDYYNPIDDEDFVSRANTSYLLLQSGTGLTTADMADVTGTYGTYQHAYYAGSDGSMKYYCVDGTAIANHMDKTSPNGMLWSAICLGMATDGLHAPLRAKGLEVAYGYSQSVTFDYDYKWEAVFWDNMIAGKNVAQSIAAMKSSVGNWDYITQYTTISSARANYCAFPVVVSSEDVYPGKGNVDNLQTVNSTWVLKDSTTPTEPTTAPTEPTTAPIEPTTAPGSDAFVVADSVAANDKIVLVASYNGKNYAMTNDTSISNALVAEEVTVSGDTVDVAATRSAGSEAIWTLEAGAEAGTYLLKSSDGKYINWTSGTTLKLADSGVSFTVTCGKETSSALVTSTIGQATVRGLILRDNGGALQFRAYSTANATASGYSGTLTVYKRAASTTPTEPTTAPTEPTTAPTEPTTAPTEPTTAPTEPTTAPSGNEYVLTTSLKDGDEVVIYNASAGKAMSEDAVSTNYRAGADVAVSGNKIVTDDSRIVWTVKASGSGFTFANDAGETLSATKGLSFATTDNVWAINPATTANSVYIVSTTAAGSQGDPKYVEWYAQYSEFSTYYYNVNNEAIFAMQLFAKSGGTVTPTEPTTAPTEPTTAPTEPTTAPTEPTTAPTEPTTAPTEPTTPPSGGAPIEEGDCVVIYNAANGVIIGYDEDTDYSQSTGDFTYWNITTEAVSVSGSTLKAEYENAGTFYVIANADGTYAFLDQYDYDQSSVSYFISAETPYTYYDSSADYAAFELIPAEGGYLLKNVGDNSYYAIENGVVVAKELVAGDPNFIFRFAIWDGTTEGDDTIVCTLVGSSTPDQPTTAPTEPTTAPTEPTSGPTEPTTAPSGNEYVLTTSLKDGDQVIIYNASAKKAMSEDA
ncbi:MAG: hypothetical protein IJG45_02560, partial [Oscillospiraceae bacterium]|nr:hypothetical protein [Oscillospiraceae bacterium]